jgi:purine-binding chemotaxis protein CheW
MSQTPSGEPETQYLTFFVAHEEYALDVMRVREVIEAAPITRVPSAPADVRGVVNLRGRVVPLVDLGLRFGGPEVTLTSRSCIVVVESTAAEQVVGLLVDSVSRVVTLAPSQVEPVPAFGTRARVELLRGVGVLGSSFVLVLLPDRVARVGEDLEAAAS